LKVRFLQDVDNMISRLLSNLSLNEKQGNSFSICITGDHSTPVLSGDHSFEPVPFAIAKVSDAYGHYLGKVASQSQLRDEVGKFSEIDAARGVLGRFCGNQVMPIINFFITL